MDNVSNVTKLAQRWSAYEMRRRRSQEMNVPQSYHRQLINSYSLFYLPSRRQYI